MPEATALSTAKSFVVMVLMVAVCLGAAHLSYFGIEIGCRQYLRGVFGIRPKKRTA